MAGQFISKRERESLNNFPDNISGNELMTNFAFSDYEMTMIKKRRGSVNRLGFSLLLCSIRYLGYIPEWSLSVPDPALDYVCSQLDMPQSKKSRKVLESYGDRGYTQTSHLHDILHYLGFRKALKKDIDSLKLWLIERALEHDSPKLLFKMACDWLRTEKVLRPKLTNIERLVLSARYQGQLLIYKKLKPFLTVPVKRILDQTLEMDSSLGVTPLSWLRKGAVANTPREILETLEKLIYLKRDHVENWNTDFINPNKLKFLAQIGRKSTNQYLQRANPYRRYPILVAFLKHTLEEIIDELIELFDRCFETYYSRSKRKLDELKLKNSRKANEELILFHRIGKILLDSDISDIELRTSIYMQISEEDLHVAIRECEKLIRPQVDNAYDFFSDCYSNIRQFDPKFIELLSFNSYKNKDPLIKALNILRELNIMKKRKIPENAPIEFIPKTWLNYVINPKGEINRKYYELCTLWELRNSLRSGDIWVEHSRRYANPEIYLIPKNKWIKLKSEVTNMLHLPESGEEFLEQSRIKLNTIMREVDSGFLENDRIRNEKGNLIITPIKALDKSESYKWLQNQIVKRIPKINIIDLLIEVDNWTNFSSFLVHAAGSQPRTNDLLIYLYASIIAQALNISFEDIADASGLSSRQLAWYTNWYFREETLKKCNNCFVDFHHNLPESRLWGEGSMSSSDGQRFPVPVKSKNAAALPKYFGYGTGLTMHSWTSDQLSQFASKVGVPTKRDSTTVLDGILDNETELPIVWHTTDTAGYTELIFALFDLLGLQFSPRIRDMGNQSLYCFGNKTDYPNIAPFIKGNIKENIIIHQWENILRITGSLKLGWVTSSLLVSKLQSSQRQNIIAKALKACGHIPKTIHILRWMQSEEYCRKNLTQLNKGESLHALRRFLFYGNLGAIKKSQYDDQLNLASCLTLVTNAVIIWNTKYYSAIINQLKAEGFQVNEEDLTHIWPCRYEHINKHGHFLFNIEQERNRKKLRELRKP